MQSTQLNIMYELNDIYANVEDLSGKRRSISKSSESVYENVMINTLKPSRSGPSPSGNKHNVNTFNTSTVASRVHMTETQPSLSVGSSDAVVSGGGKADDASRKSPRRPGRLISGAARFSPGRPRRLGPLEDAADERRHIVCSCALHRQRRNDSRTTTTALAIILRVDEQDGEEVKLNVGPRPSGVGDVKKSSFRAVAVLLGLLSFFLLTGLITSVCLCEYFVLC